MIFPEGLYMPPSSGNAPYFIILLCPPPDDFNRQVESAATQWVNNDSFRFKGHSKSNEKN
jgi:predicted small lipoprotein YifL